ncbi:MAG TPA: DUF2298 domain-containing protein [Iamia sp.]|nr:DUF2298 domain-containing protein [Iamia sp.]
MSPAARRRAGWWAALALVTLGGGVLRLTNLDFDQRQHLHPDERHWSLTASALADAPAPDRHGTVAGPVLDWLDGERSPANPYRATDTFVYGPSTLAATRAVAGWMHDGATGGDQPAAAVVDVLDAAGLPLLDDGGAPRFDDRYQVDLVGRLLGALADTLTIVVVGLAGRRLGGRWVGLGAAALFALSVLAIQHAHFFGSEPVLGLASALTIWATLALDRGDRVGPAVATGLLAGAAAGATVAVKLSGSGVALVPLLAGVALLVARRRPADVARLAAVAVGAAVAFRVLCPAAFEGLGILPTGPFWADVERSREVAAMDLPPALQWAGRIPVLDAGRHLVWFTVGPGAAAAAGAGAVALLRRRRALGWWPVLVAVGGWALPAALVLRGQVTTGRYFVPMLPALCACGGYGLAAGVRWARARPGPVGRLATAGVALVLATTGLWGVAFVAGVHGDEHTRIRASRWIGAHVEPGSVLSVQAWDDGLPLARPGSDPTAYELEQLDLFGVDRADKTERLAEQLTRIDYVVESSPRVWRVVPRLPARFPSTIRFFEALDDGSLGFDRVATFTSPPELGPWRLDDGAAEEAFSVYDHPEVRIWRKVRDLPAATLLGRLDPVAASTALAVHPDAGHANGAMLHAGERAENDRAGTFADDFATGGHPLVHAAGWLLVLELLGLAAFTALAPALRALPDAGAGTAPLVGLAVTAFATFAAVTWLGLPLTRGLVLVVVGGWLAVGVGCARRHRTVLAELWRERRPTLLTAQAVIVAAFALGLLLRAADPDLWHIHRGGEKPFELAMFTAVLRTRTLPPYDPWYAGGTLNYYYGGYLLLSVPARLLRTAPALAMNLSLATVAALAGGAAASAGAAVARLRTWVAGGGEEPAATAPGVRRAALLAVAFVLVVPSAAIVPSIVGRLAGSERGTLDWWGLSRTFPSPSPVITEFPAWSFLFGDVHPHVMGLPLLLALVAVVVAWARALVDGRPALVVALLAGLLVGAVRATNTWDLPLAAGLLLAAPGAAAVLRAPLRRCVTTAAAAAAVVLVGWAPYAWRTEVTDSGVEAATLATPFTAALAHFGLLGAASVVVVLAGAIVTWRAAPPTGRRRTAVLGAGAGLVALTAVVAVAVPDRAVLVVAVALALAAGTAGVAALRRPRGEGPSPVALLLVGLGWALVAGVEVVTVVNDFERQNTVFKVWYQAWVLVALGVAVAVAGTVPATERLLRRPRERRPGRAVALAVLAPAVLMAVAFVQLAVPARLDDRTSAGGPSLDGLAYLDDTVVGEGARSFRPGDDRPLIAWLQENVRGTPTVAEAAGDDYSWSGRIAVHTGLPSVIGWPYHQSQQRRSYEPTVYERAGEMATLYQSLDPEPVTAILQRHRVGYVVFGTLERLLVPTGAHAALAEHPCLTIAFRHDDLWIGRVDQPCLARQPGGLPIR